jgi:uncharacterized MAPEG superfamily protein
MKDRMLTGKAPRTTISARGGESYWIATCLDSLRAQAAIRAGRAPVSAYGRRKIYRESLMNWVYLSLLLAGILPIVCAGVAKAGFRQYDNRDPRAWLARQTGFRARANAAQANSFEAFPFFAAGVLAAIAAGVDGARLAPLCIAFVLIRIAYIGCYLADRATLRSLVWVTGYGIVVALYVLAMLAR